MRNKLPETRQSITRKGNVGLWEFYITVSFYEYNNEPGEVFIKVAKEGQVVSGFSDIAAILISMCLQHEVPWSTIKEKLLNTKFDPSGFNDVDKVECSSLPDAYVKCIDNIIEYRKANYE